VSKVRLLDTALMSIKIRVQTQNKSKS